MSPPRRKGRIEGGSVQTVGRFDYHGRRRTFGSFPELDHESLATLRVPTPGKNLSGRDTSGDREFEGIVMGVEAVDAPQPRNDGTFPTVGALGTCVKVLDRWNDHR
jgi:hypothetical protein